MKTTAAASIKVPTPLFGTVKAGLYIVNSLGALTPYRVSGTGATWYPYPDRAEAEHLAKHLGHDLVELRMDSVGK